ncbi:hypothetical protein Scep_004542 [Stephania cephalantha]|uniref:Uncharacterized protein n=1 Tax=Stephania cephalantha TaxID=152367 RepID=A0AAP0KU27_9MAGN
MKPGEKETNEGSKDLLEQGCASASYSFLRLLRNVFIFLQSPNPLLLASTNGVSVDFPSFSYSYVSFR